jgi:hypothetical protein
VLSSWRTRVTLMVGDLRYHLLAMFGTEYVSPTFCTRIRTSLPRALLRSRVGGNAGMLLKSKSSSVFLSYLLGLVDLKVCNVRRTEDLFVRRCNSIVSFIELGPLAARVINVIRWGWGRSS